MPRRTFIAAARRAVALALTLPPAVAGAQGAARGDSARPAERWYDRVSLRGYAQARYNRLLESNERLVCPQCDRSLGRGGGIFLRRARVSVVAQVTDRVQLVLQPDFFTAESGEASGMAQVRDAYAEIALDRHHTARVRLGQTNVPYGWENLVSSQRRLPLDRSDPLNSAAPTERDLGLYVMWTPRGIQARYDELARATGEKGTGDVGVVSLGAYNGQTANRPEQNDNLHTVLRVAYPFAVRGQFVEAAVHGYTGRYVVTAAQRTGGGTPLEFADRRVGWALVLHPRPLGLQAEWNVGTGPEADPATRSIRERRLSGGYVQAMLRGRVRGRQVIPYARAQRYDGAKKFETDARAHRVRELEAGVEWGLSPELELTTAFMAAERTTSDLATAENRQRGHRARLQLQIAF
jgi:hypothetical protein